MAYSVTNWNTGDPITQEKMNKIEQGIANATSTADSNSTNISAINSSLSNIT